VSELSFGSTRIDSSSFVTVGSVAETCVKLRPPFTSIPFSTFGPAEVDSSTSFMKFSSLMPNQRPACSRFALPAGGLTIVVLIRVRWLGASTPTASALSCALTSA
jgi:hypothetical protein